MNSSDNAKILVVNANSSACVTEGIKEELRPQVKLLNINIEYTEVSEAPAAIESSEDVKIAHKLTTDFVEKAEADAFVIACFCDPGVEELRALGYQNVFGIGESAMHLAANMAGKFGMLSISDLSIKRHQEQVARAGLTAMLAADLPLDMGVLELEDIDLARPRIEKMARKLVDEYDARSIILGCAGMGLHRAWLQDLIRIPIIEPCWAGVAMATAALGTLKT